MFINFLHRKILGTFTCRAFHDTSFLTALKSGDKLGFKIPNDIQIIAIEIIESKHSEIILQLHCKKSMKKYLSIFALTLKA